MYIIYILLTFSDFITSFVLKSWKIAGTFAITLRFLRYVIMHSVSGSMLEIYFTLTLQQKQVTDVSLVLKDSNMKSENLSSLI